MVEIFQAIVLGVIEGITEFLPISSTGHLMVSQELIGYKDTAEIFTVVIQMGAIAAVIWHYRDDLFRHKLVGFIKREKESTDFIKKWVLATIPAAVAGLIAHKALSDVVSLMTIATALIVGGLLILIIEHYHKEPTLRQTKPDLSQITTKQALKIGLFQVFALFPGVSRSGSTIMGGLLSGVSRVNAAAFSFYLSIPIILLAGGFQLLKGYDELDTVSGGGPALLLGTVFAFISAYVSIRWLIGYVSKHSFRIFAYYRIVVGVAILLMLKW